MSYKTIVTNGTAKCNFKLKNGGKNMQQKNTEGYADPTAEQAIHNNMREENEAKKRYLNSYKDIETKIQRLEAELKELRINKMCPSQMLQDGMPHGSGQTDLSAYMAAVDSLEQKIMHERYLQIQRYEEIREKIEQMKNEREKNVLFYRYIRRKSFEWITEKMGCSYRSILYTHGEALKNFKI